MRSLQASFVALVLIAAVGGLGGCHHNGVEPDLGAPSDMGDDLSVAVVVSTDMAFPIVFNPDLGTGCIAKACDTGQCGPVADGCGGLLQCGGCPANQSCGGGGTSSVCGTPCVAATCSTLGVNCGAQSDGCGGTLDCGTCTSPATCGGSGTPSVCGNSSVPCTPTTCSALGFTCGPAGDGCGHPLDCGSCTSPQICGGGGVHAQCGAPPCAAKSCSDFGTATCGPVGDGCGGIIQCGSCSEPQTCGGQTAGQCGIPSTCTGLCQQQTSCSTPATTTTLSGTVYAPNGVDPLPNVLVYVPNGTVSAFTPGVACETCTDNVTGSPLVSAATDTSGHFSISNMPVGSNIPLVIQTGRWRRQVTVSNVAACQDNPVAASLTRLPKNKTEGDIPQMAFVTGRVDVLECVMRKIGIDDSEFTSSNGNGRVHLYKGDGMTDTFNRGLGGAVAPDAPPDMGTPSPNEDDLTNTSGQLDKYDMILFPCKGDQYNRPTSPINQQSNLINYANAGGRIFATHFSYTWLYNDSPFSSTAAWDVGQCDPTQASCFPADQTGYIDTNFPKGLELAQWLQAIGASSAYAQIMMLQAIRLDVDSVNAPTQRWMTIHDSNLPSGHNRPPLHMTFNTPVGAASSAQCGRVLFDDFHVENVSSDMTFNAVFPNECPGGAMTAQEKLLEFMIFDLGSCVTPDVPVCNKTTCNAQNIHCGPAGDGCGGVLDCGACVSPQTCGGGGVPSQCGAPSCTKITCASQNIECGPASDGCGGALACGTCDPGDTCGGGGAPGKCGMATCVPITCAAQHITCGPAGNGCGGQLDCGACTSPQTCGGNGTPGQCGQLCEPKTCQQLGFNCGLVGDGCGGQIDCGNCSAPSTCGGGGKANVCGGGVIQ